ncbi:hypothetical protein PPL_01199 [Heterostelium album PN500]|uniref:Uncharacterized protein n=1 Tax=Heterostelium pallidum (strain ATCC 26659 / Pp 5 / PN500) TaxID=670386 RepID=D3AYD9_HETP5|nr:hypothetical protein PPL_01199 [Heterostelium album PN500]EFA85966.1 hypothetical protein PPL_01199 [Heterostelium album PN500]|eukprot:XP_020438072.1 hypothetical protein PPL_01199 [Heterostelium album PN500]
MYRVATRNLFKFNWFGFGNKNVNNNNNSNNIKQNKRNNEVEDNDDDEDGLDKLIASTQSLIDKSRKVTELGDKYKDTMLMNSKLTDEIKLQNQKNIQETIDNSMKELEDRFNNIEFDANMNIVRKDVGKAKVVNEQIDSFQKRLDQLFVIAKEHIINTTANTAPHHREDFRDKIKKLTQEIDESTYLSEDLKSHFKNTAKGLEELDEESK